MSHWMATNVCLLAQTVSIFDQTPKECAFSLSLQDRKGPDYKFMINSCSYIPLNKNDTIPLNKNDTYDFQRKIPTMLEYTHIYESNTSQ